MKVIGSIYAPVEGQVARAEPVTSDLSVAVRRGGGNYEGYKLAASGMWKRTVELNWERRKKDNSRPAHSGLSQ